MEPYVNRYRYVPKVIKEEMRFKYNYSLRYLYIFMGIGAFMIFLQMLMLKQWHYLLYLLAFAVVYVLSRRYVRVGTARGVREVKEKYPDGWPVIEVSAGEELQCFVNGELVPLTWETYQGFFDTENLIVLLFQKGQHMALHKARFVQGEAEACMEFLKTKKPDEPFSRLFS